MLLPTFLIVFRNPNETPAVSSVDISHPLIHNHIATLPGEGNNKLSLTNDNNNNNSNNNHKQKRQANAARRNKRNREHGDSERSDEEPDEFDETEEDRGDSTEETTERGHKDRLDDTGTLHMPFWDTYDAINQLYLQVGE